MDLGVGLKFGVIVLLFNPSALELEARHSPSGFSDRVQNSWFHQLWQVVQVLKLQSSPRPLHYHHHVWLLVWSSFYEINTPSKKFNICLISPQKTDFCAKVLGIIKIFFGKCETSLLLVSSDFCLGNLPWMTFLPSLFLIVESWTLNSRKWDLQFFRCCSGFFYNLLDESSLCSWINFGRPATPGKVHHSVGSLCNLFLKLLSKSN